MLNLYDSVSKFTNQIIKLYGVYNGMNTTVIMSNTDILNSANLKANFSIRIKAWKSKRRTITELEQLTDLQLQDVGLVRADIPVVAAKIASKLY